MPAYYIALRRSIKNEEEMKIYLEKAPASVVNHPFKQLVAYGRTRSTSGEDPGVVAIMEFPAPDAPATTSAAEMATLAQ